MATRSVQVGDDVESAMKFLAAQKGTTADELFSAKIDAVFKDMLMESDGIRFKEIQEAINAADPSGSITKLRELLV